MSNWIGKTIGKVHIDRLVARGGMAEVYLGTHVTLDRPVAVKVLLSHLEDEPDLKDRFQREARVLASLRHASIVQIYDYDLVDGQPYIAMEFVSGPTLNTYLREMHQVNGRLSQAQIGRLLVMLAAALDYAHGLGVIHRDVKPANILLHVKNGAADTALPSIDNAEPILTDFGLLRLVDSASKSTTGTVAGTPAYMSPEQARGEHVDGRSDIYSLGIVLYELLAGGVPFDADTTMGILMKHIQEPPPPIPDLPYELELVLEKALAKKPADRYSTARELARAYLSAANLTMEDVAPGFSITPRSSKAATLPAQTAPATPIPVAHKKPQLGVVITGLVVIALLVFVAVSWLLPLFASGKAANTDTMPNLESFGLVRFHDVTGHLDEVTVSSDKIPAPSDGFQYEAWLLGNEQRLSLGYLKFDASGNSQVTYIDAEGRNLVGVYDQFEITLEPNPDASPRPSDQVVYSSGLPPKASEHLRHLLVSFDGTPNQTPYAYGLLTEAELINAQAEAMLTASSAQNADEVKKSAEAIYNIIVGNQDNTYGDLDGDGAINDPSDGYGLLLNGTNSGYIEGAIHHSTVAAEQPDATANIHHHAPHISDPAKNIDAWAIGLRDLTLAIIADPLSAQGAEKIRQAVSLANRILNGQDLNGNELIDPIIGEGGAETIKEHAQYMMDMPILAGADQLPPAAPPSSSEDTMGNMTPTPGGSDPYGDPYKSP